MSYYTYMTSHICDLVTSSITVLEAAIWIN